MSQELRSKRIAVLVADGFEQVELTQPSAVLKAAGATVEIVSPQDVRVQGWHHFDKGDFFPVDVPLSKADARDYDALLLPGGVANPDQLRTCSEAVSFVQAFFTDRKPVAAICHGPWILIEADVVKSRSLTSWPSLKTDLKNAGASWINQEVVVDKELVTSRNPNDIPAFNQKMIETFAGEKVAS